MVKTKQELQSELQSETLQIIGKRYSIGIEIGTGGGKTLLGLPSTDQVKALHSGQLEGYMESRMTCRKNRQPRILLVDDLNNSHPILLEFLQSNYELINSNDGIDALKTCLSDITPDLVLLETEMVVCTCHLECHTLF